MQQEQAIDAMSRLLNALLDISKLESGAIKPEPIDFTVAAVFEELRIEFAGIAANKGIRLDIEACTYAVHSDASLVEQILRRRRSYWPCFESFSLVHHECLALCMIDERHGHPAEHGFPPGAAAVAPDHQKTGIKFRRQ
jgi:hypothetical protein